MKFTKNSRNRIFAFEGSFILFALVHFLSAQNVNLTLETPLGTVQGHILQSRDGRDYYAFYKIPYAQPPIGELRFKSPQPATKWEGIRNESEVAVQCIQKDKYNPIDVAIGEEDCLYMNIYTPKLPDNQTDLLPTLFYIHGGGLLDYRQKEIPINQRYFQDYFRSIGLVDGNGSRYGAKYFMDEPVILITFQYRLGPFGFLSTEDGELKGNMAFKDQVMGLRFVRDYIKYFNGDPDNVMIFGNSAGGFSVSQLMVSPMASGLFHKAITQSGGSFCQSLFGSVNATQTFESLGNAVGCSGNQSNVIDCLRTKDAQDLAIIRSANISYQLVVEQYETEEVDDVFMPDSVYNMVKNGNVNRVPWIIGVINAEWVASSLATLLDTQIIQTLNENFTQTANELLNLNLGMNAAEVISSRLKSFYFGANAIGNETERNLTNLLTDRSFIHCSKVQALMQSEYSDVYMYYLSKKPEKSYADPVTIFFPPGDYGASHADELQYIFNYNGYPEYPFNSSYYPFSRQMVRIWSKFAATGDPSPIGRNWEAVKPGQNPISYFELNDNPKPTTVLQERIDFWDQFTHTDLNLDLKFNPNYNNLVNSPFDKLNTY